MKTALIFGATGQDGSYLSELLLSKGYAVVGVRRRTSTPNLSRIEHLLSNQNFRLVYADLCQRNDVQRVIRDSVPDEIYNLGAQSDVSVSFIQPEYTRDTIVLGTRNVLGECVWLSNRPKIYLAGSSEMYGNSPPPQSEKTPFLPVSPYGRAKADAFKIGVSYRERHGMFVSNGILFNHESPRRGTEFVTRKITRALGRMACGLQETCALGNLDAKRDWGHARDYVEAMWMILQHEKPDDFVIATGETRTVENFLYTACDEMHSKNIGTYRCNFTTDTSLLRPTEVHCLQGDSFKAREILGWNPKTTFRELVSEMVRSDYELARNEAQICALRTK